MREDATAARAALPTIRYRPGRGLTFTGADKSWAARLSVEWDMRLGFFPHGKAKDEIDDMSETGGPSAFSTISARLRPGFHYAQLNGLYTFGAQPRFETSRHASLRDGASINLGKFSPYYPNISLQSYRPDFNPQGVTFSSIAGTSLNRPMGEDSMLRSGSTEGHGFVWENVPLGMGRIKSFDVGVISGVLIGDKTEAESQDQHGFHSGLVVEPFSKSKDKWLKGIQFGVGFFRDHTDAKRGRNGRYNIAVSTRNNRVEIFQIQTRGSRWWVAPNVGYKVGQVRLGFAWGKSKAERDFTGKRFRGVRTNLGDAEVKYFLVNSALFFWSPKGFLSGSERAPNSLMIAYNFRRHDFDNGKGFASLNSFDEMRRYHVVENTFTFKWFQRSNLVYTVELVNNEFNKMKGASTESINVFSRSSGAGTDTVFTAAGEARRRLAISQNGGTYTALTLGVRYNF
jgi:hypothetical protein